MEHFTPINPEIDQMSDEDLMKDFKSDKRKYGRIAYYGTFAKRLPKFKGLLLSEALGENTKIYFFGFIKLAWLPILAAIDFCEDEHQIKQIADMIKSEWSNEDYGDFLQYFFVNDYSNHKYKKYFKKDN